MDTKIVKTGESGVASEPQPLLAVEIGLEGIQRVLIYHSGKGAIDEQTEAHLLLARVMAQLMLLDDALRSEGGSVDLGTFGTPPVDEREQ